MVAELVYLKQEGDVGFFLLVSRVLATWGRDLQVGSQSPLDFLLLRQVIYGFAQLELLSSI